jgi:hypothetical protein
MKRVSTVALGFVLALCLLAQSGFAAILVDRGLPTANLNNDAGVDRSNVAWADTDPALMMGDDFTLPWGFPLYHIDMIRVWVVGNGTTSFGDLFNSVSLYLRPSVGDFSLASSTPTVTPVTYVGGANYQGYSGNYSNIYQLDYPVDITAGSITFDFAIVGDGKTANDLAYLHASNAGLSGSTQQGSDGHVYAWKISDSYLIYDLQDYYPETWDKGSDFNVQVFGNVVPEPTTIIIWSLFGVLGIVVGYWRRKRAA